MIVLIELNADTHYTWHVVPCGLVSDFHIFFVLYLLFILASSIVYIIIKFATTKVNDFLRPSNQSNNFLKKK